MEIGGQVYDLPKSGSLVFLQNLFMQTDVYTDRHTNVQTEREIDGQTDRKTNSIIIQVIHGLQLENVEYSLHKHRQIAWNCPPLRFQIV